MTALRVPCPTCAGTGNHTLDGGRNNRMDTCTVCGGEGTIPARTGEVPVATYQPPAGMLTETITWFPASDAVEGQIYLVAGGVAYRKGDQWFTLTGCEWPGRPIEWKVTHYAPLQYPPEVRL